MSEDADKDKPAPAPAETEAAKPGEAGAAAANEATGGLSRVTTTAKTDKEKESKKPTMAVKVYAPFKVYYEGDAYSVTALNESGPFDILPGHRNFICMLMPCDLVIDTPYDTQTVKISRALMHVRAEKITIYLDV
jgi:hypothetical protein